MAAGDETEGRWLEALRVYLGVLAAASLVWEMAHLPLYTIWSTGSWRENAFAVVHCTGGDVLIGLTALATALVLAGTPGWPARSFRTVAGVAIPIGLAYTAFSEWLNVYVRGAWAYSEWMPLLHLGGKAIGLTPLAQWVVVPALAFAAVRRRCGLQDGG